MKRRLYRKRHRVRHAAASVALLFLTACAGTAEPEAMSETAETQTAARTETDKPALPQPAPPTPPVNDDPAQILGMAPAALDGLLGAPVRVRRDGAAEIRQYRAANVCQLDAFVYRDASGQHVTHVEIRRGVERLDDAGARACLRHMLTASATS